MALVFYGQAQHRANPISAALWSFIVDASVNTRPTGPIIDPTLIQSGESLMKLRIVVIVTSVVVICCCLTSSSRQQIRLPGVTDHHHSVPRHAQAWKAIGRVADSRETGAGRSNHHEVGLRTVVFGI